MANRTWQESLRKTTASKPVSKSAGPFSARVMQDTESSRMRKITTQNHQEKRAAASHNQGLQRRNSMTQADMIHSLQPSATNRAVSANQLEAIRRPNGSVDPDRLMGLVHPASEKRWEPDKGGGRQQIRTGRNFTIPDSAGGKDFTIRLHTNDNTRTNPAENAYGNAVLRVEQGNKMLMGQAQPQTKPADPLVDWSGKSSKNQTRINSAHMPLRK